MYTLRQSPEIAIGQKENVRNIPYRLGHIKAGGKPENNTYETHEILLQPTEQYKGSELLVRVLVFPQPVTIPSSTPRKPSKQEL